MPAFSALTIGWLTVPLGLLLIGGAMLDVMLTVLHVQAESPISNALNRKLWACMLAPVERVARAACP